MLGLLPLSSGPVSSAAEDEIGVVDRRVRRCTARANWAAGSPSRSATGGCWMVSRALKAGGACGWARGEFLGATGRHPWAVSMNRDTSAVAHWVRFFEVQFHTGIGVWVAAVGENAWRNASWSSSALFRGRPYYGGPWLLAAPAIATRILPWNSGAAKSSSMSSTWARADAIDAMRWVPWVRYSRALSPGLGVVTPPNPGGDREPLFEILPSKVYIVLNSVTLRRASDDAPVPVFSLALSIDVESFAWSFSADAPVESEALLMPSSGGAPVELIASVNGAEFRLLAESLSRERSFGKTRIKVSGRSHSAALATPYAAQRSFTQTADRTAQQLMNDALTLNGVPLGWAVDWGLTDWFVPAGAFAHQGSPMSAVQAIAAAAGGYVQPHRTAQTLRIRARYPVQRWLWSGVTPDVALPADVTVREGLQWVDKPVVNRVYVSGEGAGVLGQVTRTGTAGDALAPMVVDRLITHADAARQRGIAVLSDSGRSIGMTLSLPVLPATGVIEPGIFVQYQDGSTSRIGLVRSTQIDARMPQVRQTIGVEVPA